MGGSTDSSPGAERIRLRNESIEWREVEGQIVALDLRTSVYFAVNETGTRLWADLAGGTSRRDMVRHLVDRFGLEEQRAAGDVDAFLAELTERDLIERG